MRSTRRLVVLFLAAATLAGAAAAAGCSDTDPRYGPPEAIRGRTIDYGGSTPSTPAPAGEGGTGTKTAAQAFSDVYKSVSVSCGSCHLAGTSGAPIFFGADEATTYTLFKTNGYEKAGSNFYVKPQHLGPPLGADQKLLMDAWIAAEAAGGTGTPSPADASAE